MNYDVSQLEIETKIIFKTKDTSGDIDLTTPLHKMPEMGVFTSDIREELLSGKADIAVHSIFAHALLLCIYSRNTDTVSATLKLMVT